MQYLTYLKRQINKKTPNSKTAIEDTYGFRFDELGLVKKVAKRLRTSQRETPR
jgi:hypothetical protein